MSYTMVDSLNKLASLLGDSNTTNDDFWPLAIRKKELNRGELQLSVHAKDLLGYATGTVTSTKTITVPSDWLETYVLKVNGVVITNDREISLFDIERYANNGDTRPYYYFWADTAGTLNIYLLGNVEDLSYQWYYFKKPTAELSDNDDESLHQEEFRDGTAYYAASELLRQVGKNAQADEYRAVYEAMAQQADAWARRTYIRKESAQPDLGIGDQNTVDVQGQGTYY